MTSIDPGDTFEIIVLKRNTNTVLGHIQHNTVDGQLEFKTPLTSNEVDPSKIVVFTLIDSRAGDPNNTVVVTASLLSNTYEIGVGSLNRILDPFLKNNYKQPFIVTRFLSSGESPSRESKIFYNKRYRVREIFRDVRAMTKSISIRDTGPIKEGRLRFGAVGNPIEIEIEFVFPSH